jgi:DNA-directed RNA polymerase specialized sigma24 family protein
MNLQPDDQEQTGVRALLRDIKREAREYAAELSLPRQAGYDILTVIHAWKLGDAPESSISGLSPSSFSCEQEEKGVPMSADLAIEILEVQTDDFAALYEYYYQPVLQYIKGFSGMIAGSQSELQDLVAETFIRTFAHLEQCPHGYHHITSLLFTIAKKVVIEVYRRESSGYSEKCGEFGSAVASRLAIPRDYPNSQSSSREESEIREHADHIGQNADWCFDAEIYNRVSEQEDTLEQMKKTLREWSPAFVRKLLCRCSEAKVALLLEDAPEAIRKEVSKDIRLF